MAQLKLATTITTPLAIGHYLIQPNVVYSTASPSSAANPLVGASGASIAPDNIYVVSAIARGILVFADSTSITTFLGDPCVKAFAKIGHIATGYFGFGSASIWNVYGVA